MPGVAGWRSRLEVAILIHAPAVLLLVAPLVRVVVVVVAVVVLLRVVGLVQLLVRVGVLLRLLGVRVAVVARVARLAAGVGGGEVGVVQDLGRAGGRRGAGPGGG